LCPASVGGGNLPPAASRDAAFADDDVSGAASTAKVNRAKVKAKAIVNTEYRNVEQLNRLGLIFISVLCPGVLMVNLVLTIIRDREASG
jgi:hypothetical protein